MATFVRSAGERWIALRQELGQRLSKRLFDELSSDPDQLQPATHRQVSWGLSIAYLAAGLVFATSLTLGILGVYVLLMPWGTIFTPVIGIFLVALCVASRPRAVPPPYDVLSRAEFPTLYTLADRIAEVMGTKPVVGIAKSVEFGANYRQASWRKKPYIKFGAPLLAVLNHEERVAVIAHELYHGANGDPLRATFLYGAVITLAAWARMIRPTSIGNQGNGMPAGPLVSLVAIPFELVMLLASEFVFLWVKGLYLLVLRQSQRAEYLADRLAASVSGSDAMQSALEKTYLAESVSAAIRSHAWASPSAPIGDRLARVVHAVTPEEMEKLRMDSLASQWQVDSTHPPTALRIEMLRLKPVPKTADLLSSEEAQALDAEIDRIVASTQRELVNLQLEADAGW